MLFVPETSASIKTKIAVYGGISTAIPNYTHNTALGDNALANTSNTSTRNTAIGNGALQNLNTTGTTANTAVGYGALQLNTTGATNTAIGGQAGGNNTTGSNNIFVGWRAGWSNTTGSQNFGIGLQCLNANTTGSWNSGFGYQALSSNSTASYNMAFGYESLLNHTTGNYNLAIGHQSGEFLADGVTAKTSGTGSILIGKTVRSSANGLTNEHVIGNDIAGNGSNTTTLQGAPYVNVSSVVYKIALTLSDALILKSTAAAGIKIDEASPGYGYADLKGHKTVPTSGQTAPTRTQFRTGVYAPGYDQGDVIDWEYHLEHGDMIGETYFEHLHIMLPEGCTASGADLVITSVTAIHFHNRTGSPSPITKTFTITPAQLNAAPNGVVIPTEQIISQAVGDDITSFNSNNWRIDDTITSSVTFTSVPTLSGGLGQKIGLSNKDFHRKINGTGVTKYREMATTGSFHGTT